VLIPVLGKYPENPDILIDITRDITCKKIWISKFLISKVISLFLNLKMMRSGHIISRQGKKMLKFDIYGGYQILVQIWIGHERGLHLGFKV